MAAFVEPIPTKRVQMTLIVARSISDEIRILCDSKVTEPQTIRSGPMMDTLKAVILQPSFAYGLLEMLGVHIVHQVAANLDDPSAPVLRSGNCAGYFFLCFCRFELKGPLMASSTASCASVLMTV